MQIMAACIKNERELKLTAGGQYRDFIHIDDAVSAMRAVLEAEMRHDRGYLEYEVGTGEPVQLREFVEHIHRTVGSKTELRFGDLPYRDGEIMRSVAEDGRLAALGWKPAVTWRKGVELVLTHLQATI